MIVTKIIAKPKPSPTLLAKYWISFAIGSPRMYQIVPVGLPFESRLTQPVSKNNNDKLSPEKRTRFSFFFNRLFPFIIIPYYFTVFWAISQYICSLIF